MSGPDLIEGYLAELADRLPAPIAAELADGLLQTYEFHRRRGLSADDAAGVAIAEFGSPTSLIAAFASVNPARAVARSLLLAGPFVGAGWAAVLLTRHAWEWPVAVGARIGFGAQCSPPSRCSPPPRSRSPTGGPGALLPRPVSSCSPST